MKELTSSITAVYTRPIPCYDRHSFSDDPGIPSGAGLTGKKPYFDGIRGGRTGVEHRIRSLLSWLWYNTRLRNRRDEQEEGRRRKELAGVRASALPSLVSNVRDYAIFMLDPQGYIVAGTKGEVVLPSRDQRIQKRRARRENICRLLPG